jgi:phospholipid/cholesterol/gamma-HCH transport system permease protein
VPLRAASESTAAEIRSERDDAGNHVLSLGGRLDSDTTGGIWREAMRLTAGGHLEPLVIDASDLEFCDGAGASLLLALRQQQQSGGGSFALRGLRDETHQLLDLIEPSEEEAEEPSGARESFVTGLGRDTLQLLADMRQLVAFVGEMTVQLWSAVRHPRQLRFKDVVTIAERAGIGAVPIIALVGFLLGLILAFQSAIPMQRFGAQIFVADLLGISLLRELGPLMAAILLTARSGSAFAAEIGTMKVNEEVDALTTMGLEPVRFLVVPRIIAAVAVVPVLAMLMNLSGLIGGAVVFLSLDFPLVTFVNRVVAAVSLTDFLGGLFKAFIFGIIVAAVGCLRGLQTKTGAGAVGESTTSSVVSGIVLIAFIDGLFGVIFYLLGI